MSPRPSAPARPWRALVLVVAAVAAVAAAVPATPAVAQDDDAAASSTATVWRVDPDARAVDVEVVHSGVNDLTEAISGVFETVPDTAVDVRATSRGRTLDVLPVATDGDYTELLVALGRTVEPGAEVAWTLRYRVPTDPAAAVVHAYVDDVMVWVSSFAAGSDDAATHRVELPARYDLGARAGYGTVTVEGATRVVEAPAGLDAYVPMVIVGEDAAARSAGTTLAATPGVILSPLPGDEGWADARDDAVTAALEGLAVVFETEVPVAEVVIEEVVADAVAHSDAVFVGERGDVAVVRAPADSGDGEITHLLAHLWLTEGPPDAPWFVEGLASAIAEVAGAESDAVGPARPLEIQVAGPPLVQWSIDEPLARALAHVAVGEVVDEIGVARALDAHAVLAAGTITYPGVPPPEPQPRPGDWRTVLDALTEIGGSRAAVEVMSDRVLGEEERAELPSWRAARATWAELLGRSGGWAMPPALRIPMAAWDFAAAADAAETVAVLLDRRDEIDEVLEPAELGVPIATRTAFETADAARLDELATTLEAQLAVAERVADAARVDESDHGLLADLGLWGEDPHGDFEVVRQRWAAGDTEGAAAAADELVDLVDGAAGRGTLRLLVPVLGITLLIGAVTTWWRRRRGAPRPAEDVTPAG